MKFSEPKPYRKMENVSLEYVPSTDQLSQNEIDEMLNIYRQNYRDYPALAENLTDDFTHAINTQYGYTDIYLKKEGGHVIAFNRFDYAPDGSAYFSSFNVAPEFAGASLGETMMLQTLDREAQKRILHSKCSAINRIGAKYIESGFIATGFTKDFHGIPVLTIIRNDTQIPDQFISKKMSQDEIKDLATSGAKSEHLHVISKKHQEDFLESFSGIDDEHFLTRYFQDKTTKDWYAVIESAKVQN